MPGKIRKRPEPPEFTMRRVDDVPLTFLDEAGARVQEKFSIEFRSYTAYGFMKLSEDLHAQSFISDEHAACEVMARSITSILDADGQPLTDDTGEPAALTASFFMGLLNEDREGIQSAIKADANPPKASPESGHSGSSPAASEA